MRGSASWYVAVGAILVAAALQLPLAFADQEDKDKKEKDKNTQQVGSCKLVFPSDKENCVEDPKNEDRAGGFTRDVRVAQGPGRYTLEISKDPKADPAGGKAPAMPLKAAIECVIPYTLDASMKAAGKCKATFTQRLFQFTRDSRPATDIQAAGTKHADYEFTGKLTVEHGSPTDTKTFTATVVAAQKLHPESDQFFYQETNDNKSLSGFVEAAAGKIVKGKVTVNGELKVTFTAASTSAFVQTKGFSDPVKAELTDVP